MPSIDRSKATVLAEDYIMKTINIEPILNTSKLVCCGVDLSEYHVFWFSSNRAIVVSGSYVAVHKEDGSIINFEF
jgi:hypothetical protein